MIDLETSRSNVELFGYSTEDYLKLWFGDLPIGNDSILLARRIETKDGKTFFKAMKGFRSNQITEAVEYIDDFADQDDLYIKTSSFDREKVSARIEAGETVVGNKHEVKTILGVAMDVDAGKRESYASQNQVWTAIGQMPVPPTMVILSGRNDHGFHVYWKLDKPIAIESVSDVETLNQRIRSWRDLLCDLIAEQIDGEVDREKLVDRTYGVDRVLRPVGAKRASGDHVRLVVFEPDRRYTLAELTSPYWTPPTPSQPSWPRAEESVIDQYFAKMDRDGNPITIEGLLTAHGYLEMGGGDWIRKDSSTKSRSLTEGEVINGLPGVNVFSGGCDPLKCGDDVNDVGRRYSLYALWVALNFGDVDQEDPWSAAAAFCHDQLKPDADEVFKPIEDSSDTATRYRITNGDKFEKSTIVPKPMEKIVEQMKKAYGEWPKACQGDLFVLGRNGKPRALERSAKLFGWMNSKAQVVFYQDPEVITKSEFFEQLPEHVDQYEAIESLPHFPEIPNHFYASKSLPAGDGKTLDRFLDFFAPSSPEDRQLILAMIVTTFWGGAPGSRPMFGIDANGGTGVGKSALAFKIASISGSCFKFDQNTNEERIRSHLAGESAADKRMVVLDNLKTTKLTSAVIETLITAPTIGGHAIYRGYREKPNHLTWCVTMNGLSLSRDLAHRTVKIVVQPPKTRKLWEESIDRFIAVSRQNLIADIRAFFDRPTTELKSYGRWSAWEHAVLSRLVDPDALRTLIKQRAKESDDDQSSSEAILSFISEQLRRLGYDLENEIIHLPTSVMMGWVSEATSRDLTPQKVNGMLTMLIGSGSLKGIEPNPCRTYGRGWLWNPKRTNRTRGDVSYNLKDKIRNVGFE